MISIDDFKKIELKVGKILFAERVEGSEKLIKLSVDLGKHAEQTRKEEGIEADQRGTEARNIRQIIAGIGKTYAPEALVGRQIVIVANLEPRQLMGMESQGMLLAAEGENGEPVLLVPEKEVLPGATVR